MKVAVLITGRLKCYENRLISLLENSNYDIDLFCSIFEGRYPCNFEPSLCQNIYDKKMPVEFFHQSYSLDPSRHQ